MWLAEVKQMYITVESEPPMGRQTAHVTVKEPQIHVAVQIEPHMEPHTCW